MSRQQPRVLLCILDGWGISPDVEGNAVAHAHTPTYDALIQHYPHCQLHTDGPHVGLPEGQCGNSEVGHVHIGAGRIVLQSLPHIDASIKKGSFYHNDALQETIAVLKGNKKTAHVMGILSAGGVHGHQDHLIALIEAIAQQHVPVCVHAFLDGRDTYPLSAPRSLTYLQQTLKKYPHAQLASISGRYYAMDRDRRWARTQQAWQAIAKGIGKHLQTDPQETLQRFYRDSITDEFVPPSIANGYHGMAEGDGIVLSHFRADRVRQLMLSFLDPDFDQFPRTHMPALSIALGINEYSLRLNRFMKRMFPPFYPKETLGDVIATERKRQLRIAETEKYAHVTYFFNGGQDRQCALEERQLLPSPRVSTYDLAPSMSAQLITDTAIKAMTSRHYALIVVNFANADMVGHTGCFQATIKALETVDTCLKQLLRAAKRDQYCSIITADHGNAECMFQPKSRKPHTAHTLNPVPFILVDDNAHQQRLLKKHHQGSLIDIAPTILHLMHMETPRIMSGQTLLHTDIRKKCAVP
ncbi:MAG: 2,3-bisphosphoglycerate-independent phosphoglycerate mutase [Alphaproteobacteria bacterium GM7ARS4]|nr:2,3-bisphosphoglycerate-independent phosphoglycerate mutase [Alphaproteobacteria bacterium GM7ARS4]